MRNSRTFVAIVALTISCGFSILAANDEPLAAESPSEESSPKLGEKPDESVPREFLGFAHVSGFRGVIDDPDGYANLRKDKRADAPVVTKVKAGEVFRFQKKGDEDWCFVKLKSGVSGWMHSSRIKLYFTNDDLPKPSEADEIDQPALEQGINYYEVTQAAARGDKKALKTFFSTGGDGAAAEEAEPLKGVMIHLIGDEAIAEFLRDQPPGYQTGLRGSLTVLGNATYPFEPVEYLQRHSQRCQTHNCPAAARQRRVHLSSGIKSRHCHDLQQVGAERIAMYESQRNSQLPTAIFGGRAINFLATPILLFNQTPQLES
jgi:Bacterial SH3 domain